MDRKKEMGSKQGADQSISEVQMGNVGKKRSEEDGVVHDKHEEEEGKKRTELMGGIQKHEKHGKKRKNNHEEGGLIQNEQGKKRTELMLGVQRNEEKGKKIQKNPEEGGLIQKNDDQGKKRTELMLGIQKHEKQGKKRKSFHNTSSDRNVEGRDMMFRHGNKNNPDPMSSLRVVSSFDDTCNLADPSLHLSDHHHGQNNHEEGGLIQNELVKKITDLMVSEKGKKIQSPNPKDNAKDNQEGDRKLGVGKKNNHEEGGLIQPNIVQEKKEQSHKVKGNAENELAVDKLKSPSGEDTCSISHRESPDISEFSNKEARIGLTNNRSSDHHDKRRGSSIASIRTEYCEEPKGHGAEGTGVCTVYYIVNHNWSTGSVQMHLEHEISARDIKSIRGLLESLIGDAIPATIIYSAQYLDRPFGDPDPNQKALINLDLLSVFKGQYKIFNFYVWPDNLYWNRNFPKWISVEFGSDVGWIDLQKVENLKQLRHIVKSFFPNFPNDGDLVWFSSKGAPQELHFDVEEEDGTWWSSVTWSPLVAAVMKILVRVP